MSVTAQDFRLYIVGSNRSDLCISEWKFFDGSGTQIATTGGTASASDSSDGAAADAFDNDTSTFWGTANQATPGAPQWLRYHFSSAVTVETFSVTVRTDGAYFQGPDSWLLQSSTDGGSTWTTIGTYSQGWTSSHTSQTFTVGTGLGDIYRLVITALDGGGVAAIAEINFYDPSSSLVSLTGGASEALSIVNSENDGSAKAFDGDATSYWASASLPTVGSPQWIQYRFAGSVTLGSFTLQARASSFTQSPDSFSLQQSTDGGATFTTLQTYAASGWTSGQVKTFTVPAVTSSIAFRRTRSALGTRAGSRQRTH